MAVTFLSVAALAEFIAERVITLSDPYSDGFWFKGQYSQNDEIENLYDELKIGFTGGLLSGVIDTGITLSVDGLAKLLFSLAKTLPVIGFVPRGLANSIVIGKELKYYLSERRPLSKHFEHALPGFMLFWGALVGLLLKLLFI